MGGKLFKNTIPEHHFKLLNGIELKNVVDLADSLKHMSDDVFYSHVDEHKNDFSNWVRDIYSAEELANALSKCKNQQESELHILRHLYREKSL